MTIFSVVDEPPSLSDVDDSLGAMPVPGEEDEKIGLLRALVLAMKKCTSGKGKRRATKRAQKITFSTQPRALP